MVNNFGTLFLAESDFVAAKALLTRSLEGREKSLGPMHPDTLTAVANLAEVFAKERRFDEAQVRGRG